MANKREIDKENMFRKIMPSAAAAQDAAKRQQADEEGAPFPQDAPEAVAAPAVPATGGDASGGTLSPDAIAALFAAQQQDAAPSATEEPPAEEPAAMEEPTPAASSQEEQPIAAEPPTEAPHQSETPPALAEPEAQQPATLAASGGTLSQDAIAALFAAQQQDVAPSATEEPPAEEPAAMEEPTPAAPPQEEQPIAAEPPTEAPTPSEAPPALAEPEAQQPATPAASGGTLSQDAIAALFAAQQAAAPAAMDEAVPPQESVAEISDTAEPIATQTENDVPPAVEEPPMAEPAAIEEPTPVAPPQEAQSPAAEMSEDEPAATEEPFAAAEPAATQDETAAPATSPPIPFAAKAAQPAPVAAAPHDAGEPPYAMNLAEVLAIQYYPRYRQRLNGCECDRCRDDILGMALNRIRPRYVSSDDFDAAQLADRELITETVTALIHATFKVKRNPHHDEIDLVRKSSGN